MTDTGTPVPRMIWARLAVDPLAEPLARRLARVRWVTPNRITALALAMALGAAVCFLTDHVRLGGALFLARYFFDCVDGMVARIQGTTSARGAAWDIAADVLGQQLVAAALCWQLVESRGLPVEGGYALLAVLGAHQWALSHRKRLAAEAGEGEGGSGHTLESSNRILAGWYRWCRSRNMAAFPWALELEMGVFGLGPLLLPSDWLPAMLWAGVAGYTVVLAVNLVRVHRLSTRLDAAKAAQQTGRSHA